MTSATPTGKYLVCYESLDYLHVIDQDLSFQDAFALYNITTAVVYPVAVYSQLKVGQRFVCRKYPEVLTRTVKRRIKTK